MNPNNSRQTASSAPRGTQKKRRGPLLVIIGSALLLMISVMILVGYFFLFPKDAPSRPLVIIHSPGNGDQVELGERVTVHATARDNSNVTRMEFWVDGDLQKVEKSGVSEGISPFPMLVSWTPESPGEHKITFRAFNSQGVRSNGYILVQAAAGDDRDLDGVQDAQDNCPDQMGAVENNGCPFPGDQDGDGIPDEMDACPDDPGLEEVDGCPDRDGDGVPDDDDADPDVPGPAGSAGAPDLDGDGVPDDEDLSPEEPGDPEAGGAPESGSGDRDGDGAADDVDPCPDDFGEPEDGFCPPADEDETDDPPGFDFELPFFRAFAFDPINIEIEASRFRVSDDYDHVWCYVQVADQPVERYEFEPLGEQNWDIAEVLGEGNSIQMVVNRNTPLPIMIQCGADIVELGPGGGWGTVFDLGTLTIEHNSSEWDGRFLDEGAVGPDGRGWMAGYRICSPTCDETAIQPPNLHPPTIAEGRERLRWDWDGDSDWLVGFALLVNDTYVSSDIQPHQRVFDISDFRPSCGFDNTFQMVAYGAYPGDDLYTISPLSNMRYWRGENCPRTVLVSFLTLDGSGAGDRVGPISGTFWANDQTLIADFRDGPPSFDATDDPERYLGGYVYNLAELFGWIETEAAECFGTCTSNYAPSSNSLEIDLGPHESLTFGGRIWADGEGLVFNEEQELRTRDIRPGVYTLHHRGTTVTVGIDVIVGPEAGGEAGLPDLVITDVAMYDPGLLEVSVFNNAADLIGEEINIAVVQMSTNEEIDFLTWSDVTIPSGGRLTLISPSAATEPYDLRLLMDPVDPSGEDGIRESNELNNIYETPVEMSVQINGFRIRNGPCESFLGPTAEFFFRIFVGHESPEGETTWVGEIRHPAEGVIEMSWSDHPWEHIGEWDLHHNDRYLFNFVMPADHNLKVNILGYEDDTRDESISGDDFAGRVVKEYTRDQNYGHDPDEYHFASEGWHECDDGTPLGWDTHNFHVWFNITRVH